MIVFAVNERGSPAVRMTESSLISLQPRATRARMRHLALCVMFAACGGGGGDAGIDAAPGSIDAPTGVTVDAPNGGSTCTNYTFPDLPQSVLVYRDQAALAKIAAMTHFTVVGNETHDSHGQLTRYVHDESGTANDFTVDFSWTSAGLLQRRAFDASGTAADTTDDMSWTSAGRLNRWTHDASGTLDDTTEDFSYTSAGTLNRWSFDASGSTADVTDDYAYTSHGLLSRWNEDASGSANDIEEDFSYDSNDRLTRWNRSGGGMTLEQMFSYGTCEH